MAENILESIQFRDAMKSIVSDVCDPRFSRIDDRLDKIQNNELNHLKLDVQSLKTDIEWMKESRNSIDKLDTSTISNSVDNAWIKDILWRLGIPIVMLVLGWMAAHIQF